MNINDIIAEKALSRMNYREIRGNDGFDDREFQLEMEMTGWQLGQSWCSYFAESVWSKGYAEYNSLMVNVIRKLFSANAVATWNNFSDSQFVTNDEPVRGAVVIWMKMRNGTPVYLTKDKQWIAGHAGIVLDPYGDYFTTAEGNSNSEGGREGIEVAGLTRTLDFHKSHGLKLLGFIHPKA